MRALWDRYTHKPTLVSVLSIPTVLVLIFSGINGYRTSDPSTVGWVLTLLSLLVIACVFLYFIDRQVVRHFNNKLLSLIELVLIIILSSGFLYTSRTLDIDLSESNQEYTLIIENTGQLTSTELNSKGLFNAEIRSMENLVVVDAIPDNIRLIKRPKKWSKGHYYNKFSFDKHGKVVLFANPSVNIDSMISDAFIDSLIQSKE